MRHALPFQFSRHCCPETRIDTTSPQSRRCHLPNNQIVNDQSRRVITGSCLGRNQERQCPMLVVLVSVEDENAQKHHVVDSRPAEATPLVYIPLAGMIQGEATEFRAKPEGRQSGDRNSRIVLFYPQPTVTFSATFLLRKLTIEVLSLTTRGGKSFLPTSPQTVIH